MQASPHTHRQLQSSSHASAQTQVQPFRVHHGRRLSHIISVPVTLKCDDEDDPNGNDNRTGLPHYFPSLTPRYVQVSGQHASQRRGTHFPTLLFLPPGKIRMVHRPLPAPWSFSSGVFFMATELLQIYALTLNEYTASATKKLATRGFPNGIRKEFRGLGKCTFSWDSHTAMTWITAVCWWHPVLVKSH